MTPEQIASARRVVDAIGRHPEFAPRFYGRLLAEAPQTAPLFEDDLDRQQRALTAELGAMVDLLDDLPALEDRARALGDRHRSDGVRAVHYRMARELMAVTLDEVLGEDFGAAERQAWTRASSLISELMQAC